MNKEDFDWWSNFRLQKRPYLENDEYKMVCEIYARVFDLLVVYPCKCNPIKIQKMINDINTKYEEIEQ